jgi:hypothetical protein
MREEKERKRKKKGELNHIVILKTPTTDMMAVNALILYSLLVS